MQESATTAIIAELERYKLVMDDEANPVRRLRPVTNTREGVVFLRSLVDPVMEPGTDVDIFLEATP